LVKNRNGVQTHLLFAYKFLSLARNELIDAYKYMRDKKEGETIKTLIYELDELIAELIELLE